MGKKSIKYNTLVSIRSLNQQGYIYFFLVDLSVNIATCVNKHWNTLYALIYNETFTAEIGQVTTLRIAICCFIRT